MGLCSCHLIENKSWVEISDMGGGGGGKQQLVCKELLQRGSAAPQGCISETRLYLGKSLPYPKNPAWRSHKVSQQLQLDGEGDSQVVQPGKGRH